MKGPSLAMILTVLGLAGTVLAVVGALVWEAPLLFFLALVLIGATALVAFPEMNRLESEYREREEREGKERKILEEDDEV